MRKKKKKGQFALKFCCIVKEPRTKPGGGRIFSFYHPEPRAQGIQHGTPGRRWASPSPSAADCRRVLVGSTPLPGLVAPGWQPGTQPLCSAENNTHIAARAQRGAGGRMGCPGRDGGTQGKGWGVLGKGWGYPGDGWRCLEKGWGYPGEG